MRRRCNRCANFTGDESRPGCCLVNPAKRRGITPPCDRFISRQLRLPVVSR